MAQETRRTIIGVDLDNTALRYSEALWADIARQDGIEDVAAHIAAYKDPESYDFHGWAGFPESFKERHLAAVDHGLYATMQAIPGAPEVLRELSDEEYHIRVITARFVGHGRNAKVVGDTAICLDREGIVYRDLAFAALKEDIFADVYIDDAPKNIEKLRGLGRRVIIFDAPYNRQYEGERAHNWDEVYELITGKKRSA